MKQISIVHSEIRMKGIKFIIFHYQSPVKLGSICIINLFSSSPPLNNARISLVVKIDMLTLSESDSLFRPEPWLVVGCEGSAPSVHQGEAIVCGQGEVGGELNSNTAVHLRCSILK